MRFIIHVMPANLRNDEVNDTDDPVWVIRSYDEQQQMFVVRDINVQGPVETVANHRDPLPNTGGHGWAYLLTGPSATVRVRTAVNAEWLPAASLFREPLAPGGVPQGY